MPDYSNGWSKVRKNLPHKRCIICDEWFKLRSGIQKVCSTCKSRRVKCACGCGAEIPYVTNIGHGQGYAIRRFKHGHNQRGQRNSKWNGGRKQQGSGYVLVLAPDHPNAKPDGYVYEHRLVMEEKIGRFLEGDEEVHHINGVRDDNRPENLQLTTHAEHARFHMKRRRRREDGKLC